jgi:hypothetical protein
VALPKEHTLKDMGLLPPDSINKLIKKGIKTPASLYYWIQEDPDEISVILNLPKKEISALGTLILLDWIDQKTLRMWIMTSLENTGLPLNYLFKKRKFLT